MRIRQISVNPAAGMASLALQSTAARAAPTAEVMMLATSDGVEYREGYDEADNGDHKPLESTGLKNCLVFAHASQYADNLTENQDG
jgi:hypothetical protein